MIHSRFGRDRGMSTEAVSSSHRIFQCNEALRASSQRLDDEFGTSLLLFVHSFSPSLSRTIRLTPSSLISVAPRSEIFVESLRRKDGRRRGAVTEKKKKEKMIPGVLPGASVDKFKIVKPRPCFPSSAEPKRTVFARISRRGKTGRILSQDHGGIARVHGAIRVVNWHFGRAE